MCVSPNLSVKRNRYRPRYGSKTCRLVRPEPRSSGSSVGPLHPQSRIASTPAGGGLATKWVRQCTGWPSGLIRFPCNVVTFHSPMCSSGVIESGKAQWCGRGTPWDPFVVRSLSVLFDPCRLDNPWGCRRFCVVWHDVIPLFLGLDQETRVCLPWALTTCGRHELLTLLRPLVLRYRHQFPQLIQNLSVAPPGCRRDFSQASCLLHTSS